jgi:hypothetical protein
MLDLKLVDMAIRERWPMSPDARARALERLEHAVSSPETRPRAFHAAVKALASLSRLNLSVVETALRARHAEELQERVTSLESKQGGKDGES